MKPIAPMLNPSWHTQKWQVVIAAVGLILACAATHNSAAADEWVPVRSSGTLDAASCLRPEWPPEALAAKHTGTVTLALLIGIDGKIKQSRITKSSGYRELDLAARDGIAKCTFTPGQFEGKPEQAWLQLQYAWTLE